MRLEGGVVGCVLASAMFVACGQSPAEKRAEEIEQAAEQVQQSAESLARGLEDMSKRLGGMTGTDPNAKPVEPVGFRELQAVLVADLPGWQKGKPTGERVTIPVNYSEAGVTFTRGDEEVEQKIVDSALNPLLVAPFAMFLTAGFEKETEHGYQKSVTIGDHPGWEVWDSENKTGELNAVINGRFVVQVEGRGIEDPKILYAAMAATDLRKLASMK